MLTTIITIVLIAIAGSAVVYLKKNKLKNQNVKTNKSIVSTIFDNIKEDLNLVATGKKSSEIIEKSIHKKLDELEIEATREFKTYIDGIINSINRLENLIKSIVENVSNCKSKAKELKQKYEHTKLEKYKLDCNRYILKSISLESKLNNLSKSLANYNDIKHNACSDFQFLKTELEEKRIDIFSQLYSIKSGNFTVDASSLNLNDLMYEFNKLVEKKEVENEVNSIVESRNNTPSTSDATSSATNEEIENYYNNL